MGIRPGPNRESGLARRPPRFTRQPGSRAGLLGIRSLPRALLSFEVGRRHPLARNARDKWPARDRNDRCGTAATVSSKAIKFK
ncbi:MAG: hypothetical protein EA420_17085 [Candidatus Competibacteraceae bacterium]|nr:MAG: hypothetical protein EA420_17085 [Candidatus Competibacteraceae bacterium]